MSDPPPAYPADSVKTHPSPPPIGYQPQPMMAGGGVGGGYPQPVLQQPYNNMNMQFGGSYQGHRALLAMLPMKLGRDPVQMKCPSCMADITTEVRTTTGMCAWIIGIILCSFL